MTPKNETTLLLLSLATTLALVGGGVWFLKDKLLPSNSSSNFLPFSSPPLETRSSIGETILVTADSTPQKQAGVEAFQKKDFKTAVQSFQSSLKTQRNDAEALIYLNNAEATAKNPVKIAVIVPIGGNLNISKEILRGVAQAQNEINQNGGIQGRGLQVLIVNDDNNPDIAKNVAESLVKDSGTLGVVGHNSSTATLAAASIYQAGQLILISATATADKIAELGDYIFRTVPPYRFEGNTLARYTVKTAKKAKTLVCFDSRDDASQSLKENFIVSLTTEGGQVASVNCDFSAPDFNPSAIISQGISTGADSLALFPSVNRLTPALEIAKANQKQLTLLGSSTLYTFQTLKEGQADISGMALAVPWHPAKFEKTGFPAQARKLWGGAVNWRTPMAYDATNVMAMGLKQGGFSRQGIQQTLANPGFELEGATGRIAFLPSGDRIGVPLLVKVAPGQGSGTGFDFVLIKSE